MPDVETELTETEMSELVRLIEDHPMFEEARQFSHCVGPDYICLNRDFVERMPIEEEKRQEILSLLVLPIDSCPTLSFITATKRPEPLSGGGKHYLFFFSPDRSRLIHAGVGTWRS